MRRSLTGCMIRRCFLAALGLPIAAFALPDEIIQGEYEGDGYAAQVVALPDGRFHIAGWRRGLPGVAANAERIADGDGSRSGDEIHFSGNIWKAAIDAEGQLTGEDDQGHHWTLHRITRESPTLGSKPPRDAVLLFDGTNTDAWTDGRTNEAHQLLGNTESKQRFEGFTLHLEFLAPVAADGALGIGGCYELPIRNSFGQEPDVQTCGALRNLVAPDVNACLPPDQWQTLDIQFTPAGFNTQDRKTRNAIITVKLNGITIHADQEITGPTGDALEVPGPEPLRLRDASGRLRFRNIWLVEKP